MKLILLRHGESQWNKENRFTGWKNVELTKNGIFEAERSAQKIHQLNDQISSITTSILKRAQHTAQIVSDGIKFEKENIIYDWRLNERHYGALQGLNKSETAKKYGEDQVKVWRRSFDIPPPFLSNSDERHPKFEKCFKLIDQKLLPAGESLKMVIQRLEPFWENYVSKNFSYNNNHLIVAHSNSLRAIVKILENLSENEIMEVNIPTGVPLIYSFDDRFNIINKKYLIDEIELKKKQELIINQGKV